MSACMIHTPIWMNRAVNPAAKQRLFAVDYASQGRTGWQ